VAHICFCEECAKSCHEGGTTEAWRRGYRVWSHSQDNWNPGGHLHEVNRDKQVTLEINPQWVSCGGELNLESHLHNIVWTLKEASAALSLLARGYGLRIDGSQDNTTQPGAAAMAAWYVSLAQGHLAEYVSGHEPPGIIATLQEMRGIEPPDDEV